MSEVDYEQVDYQPATVEQVQDHLLDTQAYLQVLVHKLGGSAELTYEDYASYVLFAQDKSFTVDRFSDGLITFKFNPNTESRVNGTLYIGHPRIDTSEAPAVSSGPV